MKPHPIRDIPESEAILSLKVSSVYRRFNPELLKSYPYPGKPGDIYFLPDHGASIDLLYSVFEKRVLSFNGQLFRKDKEATPIAIAKDRVHLGKQDLECIRMSEDDHKRTLKLWKERHSAIVRGGCSSKKKKHEDCEKKQALMGRGKTSDTMESQDVIGELPKPYLVKIPGTCTADAITNMVPMLVEALPQTAADDGKPVAISLCGGMGGMDCGFARHVKIALMSDLDETACKIYHANHPTTAIIQGNMLDWIPHAALLKTAVVADMVFADVPYQGVSVLNQNRNQSTDQRNKIPTAVAVAAEAFNSKVFILINTTGFKKSQFYSDFKETAKKTYELVSVKLEASDYGSAIGQRRMVIFGIRKELAQHLGCFDWRAFIQGELVTQQKTTTVREALASIGDQGAPGHTHTLGSAASIVGNISAPSSRTYFVYGGRLARHNGFCQTLTCVGGNQNPIIYVPEIYGDDTETVDTWLEDVQAALAKKKTGEAAKFPDLLKGLRRIDVMESMVLTGLPMSFINKMFSFDLTLTQYQKRIANIVPVEFAASCAYVGTAIIKRLGNQKRDQRTF